MRISTIAFANLKRRKGKALFLPLRLALTGRQSGPEMAGLVERIGKPAVLARLSAAAKR